MSTQDRQVRPVRLALEDGAVFHGRGFGACDEPKSVAGEVVFNTALTGYQEALTDPSYAGQILTMTAPMIGNYGVGDQDIESATPQVAGFVIRELSRVRSNYRAEDDLSSWLAKAGVIGLEGIDTRALVTKLRTQGSLRGVISSDPDKSDEALIELARQSPTMSGRNLARDVAAPQRAEWTETLGDWRPEFRPWPATGRTYRVLALDCGAKRNIYRNLAERGCRVMVVPYTLSAAEIRKIAPDGLFVSNGPGDPDAVKEAIVALREVAGEIPTFGICLGHQLLALAFGASTYKLKFGHRGANQPVRNLLTGRVEITSQNHGFAVDADSLEAAGCEATHKHLNDNTLAGFRHRTKPVFAVQYHPEASPGPHDSSYLFDCFLETMETGEPVTAEVFRRHQVAERTPEPASRG